jgi:hypothetical protein
VDVSISSPSGGPRVLDDIVILGVSDGQDSVVHFGFAVTEDILGFRVIIFPVGSINGN